MYSRVVADKLSFAGRPLLSGRHKLHPYPAMLHPLLVDSLLHDYARAGDIVFDPFCGSGVTLMQSAVQGYKSYGYDINPLALLIAKVKCAKYSFRTLESEAALLQERVRNSKSTDIPAIKNRNYWYEDDVAAELGKIRHALRSGSWKNLPFFTACLAYVCRKQSNTRQGEFKRYRAQTPRKKSLSPIDMYFDHVGKMISIYQSQPAIKKTAHTMLQNAEISISKPKRYDLVITSPPYGDSSTTVAYGQYSSFGSDWIADINPFGKASYCIDREGLGRKSDEPSKIFEHQAFRTTYNKIKKIDGKRARDVLHFFNGYYKSIANITSNLSDGGTLCFVVGNRTVRGVKIPMDQITASFFEAFGAKPEQILVRNIHNKIMPNSNSPTNVAGKVSATMTREYIVIATKPSVAIGEIEFKLREIKDLGFVPSLRSGTTGIGLTLDTLLSKKEQNLPDTDIGECEIMAQPKPFTFVNYHIHIQP